MPDFARAARYRTLALSECDSAKIALLHRLAEEAERGLLCTVKHVRLAYSVEVALAPALGVGPVRNRTVFHSVG